MTDADNHVATLIDQFLAAEKSLQGMAEWTVVDSQERRVKWPLLVGDSISDGYLHLAAYPNRHDLKGRIATPGRITAILRQPRVRRGNSVALGRCLPRLRNGNKPFGGSVIRLESPLRMRR